MSTSMPNDDSKSLDLLGIKPIADSINKVTSGVVNGSAAFLSRICLPAAEEFGLLLRDRMHSWRAKNIAEVTRKAEVKLVGSGISNSVHAHPRVVATILEEASWIDDSRVQDFWAGLLSSSCTEDGDDDSNVIFINILTLLTKLEARVIDYACQSSGKSLASNGLIVMGSLKVALNDLVQITGENDIHRLDRELDHLREIGLIQGGFSPYGDHADLTPTALAAHLYVRCQGSRASPIEFFGVEAHVASDSSSPEAESASNEEIQTQISENRH